VLRLVTRATDATGEERPQVTHVRDAAAGRDPMPPWVRASLWFGLVAVSVYVGGWFLAGVLRDGYDPREQAISELFELGAPAAPRALLVVGLLLSGVAFLLLGPALDRALPGTGRLGPVLVVVAGIGTLGVAAAPCSEGCPGLGASPTDTWHTITAGVGYTALVLAPLAVGWRVRDVEPRLASWSAAIGGLGLLLFVGYVLGVVDAAAGLQQRVFNTIADAWYVLVAVWVLRRDPTRSPAPTP
jgi:hypothetical protein